MPSHDELVTLASQAKEGLATATKEFEALRAKGSATELVKAAQAVTTATRQTEKTEFEVNTFELVGIYEGIRGQVLEALKRWDVKTLLGKDVTTVHITVPIGADGTTPEQVVVNTLGRKTIIRGTSSGDGSRSKKEMFNEATGQTMTPRLFLEQFGGDVLGDIAAKALAEPARYGLVDYAERCARKQDAGWVKRDIPA